MQKDAFVPWSECEVFCIHSYAGETGAPCGWRGQRRELADERTCPRCGRATIIAIHLDPPTTESGS